MPSETQSAKSLDGTLSIYVGFYDLPEARETGRIIERLGNAFTQEFKPALLGANCHLLLERLEIGSFFADLKAVADIGVALQELTKEDSLLRLFVQRLAVAITVLKDASGGHVPPGIRMLLEALLAPVASGRAKDARVSVRGDNATIIYIDRVEATQLRELIIAISPAKGGQDGGYGAVGPAYIPPQGQQEPRVKATKKGKRRGSGRRTGAEVDARIVTVDGDKFAKLDDMDVLIPVLNEYSEWLTRVLAKDVRGFVVSNNHGSMGFDVSSIVSTTGDRN